MQEIWLAGSIVTGMVLSLTVALALQKVLFGGLLKMAFARQVSSRTTRS